MESISFLLPLQTQQLQMQPMSRPDVSPGTTETQQMRVTAPVGVSIASSRPPTYRLITDFFLAYRPTSGYAYGYHIR